MLGYKYLCLLSHLSIQGNYFKVKNLKSKNKVSESLLEIGFLGLPWMSRPFPF